MKRPSIGWSVKVYSPEREGRRGLQMTVFDLSTVNLYQENHVIDEEKKVTHGFDKQELEHVCIVVNPGFAFVPENLSKANYTQTIE
jgi:hypothetical protein